jgi:ribosomal protein S18 acetylase RimI-like enzyme
MKKVEIRAARPEDLDSIEGIFKSYRSNYDWKYAKSYFRDYFAFPEQHPNDVVLVGVLKEQIIGVIGYLQFYDEPKDIFWFSWLYVHKSKQGNRYGRTLLDRAVREVKSKGGRKLYMTTSSWRFYSRARYTYREYGFKEQGILKDYYEKGEHQIIYGMDLT